METIKVERTYKDKLFRFVFKEKDKLLSLYNAVNKSNYTNPDDLEIVTLENAVYMNMKNDLAFLIGDWLNIYEHQSTVNPNMALRNLIYVAKEYQKLIAGKSLYSTVQIKLPTPKFIVFYNGTKEQPEKYVQQLSESYSKAVEPIDLELKVTVYNINYGYNAELLEACQTLKEYSLCVDKIRQYIKIFSLEEAVDKAIEECIKEGILSDFLLKYRAEARAMCIFEYDEEAEIAKIKKMEREDEREIWQKEIEKIKKMEREDEREIWQKEIEKIKKMEREDEREFWQKEIERQKMHVLINKIYRKAQKNKSLEQIADELDEEVKVLQPIYEILKTVGDNLDYDLICEELEKRK